MKRIIFIFSLILTFLSPIISHAGEEDNKVYTLEELLTIAIEQNPSIPVFKANLEASRGEVVSAKAYPNPEIEFQGNSGKTIDTGESKSEYSIGIGQVVEWPGKRYYRKKSAEAGVEVLENDLEDFRLQLKAEVKKAFFRLLSDKKILETAKENLKTVDEILKTVGIRVKAGEAPEFELVKARVEMLRAEKEFKRANNLLTVSRTSLNALLGNSLEHDFGIEGEFRIPEKKYELPALLSNAIERHPLILKATKDAEAKGYSLEMEKASIFPDVTVRGFFDREIDKDAYGIGLSIPIPFWYQRKGEITTARGELAKAEAEIFKTRIELSRLITEQYQNYTTALDQIEVFDKGLLKEASEALRIADLSYKQGESGLLDYLDTQRVYRSTIAEYYQSLFELEVSIASLERISGVPIQP
ncbi:MAG: hypothetical protein A2X87_00350 [Deltaproteobacteria bacterium GWC2_42_51]|nr:MAG: hypothetical protein A2056_05660 [Deltaproteobacteria bacterium GWA2_42_85]OGP27575.1 MAG: hypothetical protein A2067_02130 [Deltaproteobacteria bacterium GWB2_42_7]OGP37257.1 MAG: hypothetical protein A2X87_00350 [Deltaproteobacteria bacterium GWC2_42_51]OGP43851.1 MAG: hypothetical protein A2090_03000 [Deltaproteobacteria bacterium GWD2_42_10]OGP47848.1 MAG: hypothetical protein A2022_02975 [Deltaproteobacteria bacterium GWF2_42_12]OGQ28517.1 MAG: hypothetical protein A3D29_05135 [De